MHLGSGLVVRMSVLFCDASGWAGSPGVLRPKVCNGVGRWQKLLASFSDNSQLHISSKKEKKKKEKMDSALWEYARNDLVLLKSSLLLSVVQLSSHFILGSALPLCLLGPAWNLKFSSHSKSSVICAWAIGAPRWMEGLQCLLFKFLNCEVVTLFGLDWKFMAREAVASWKGAYFGFSGFF